MWRPILCSFLTCLTISAFADWEQTITLQNKSGRELAFAFARNVNDIPIFYDLPDGKSVSVDSISGEIVPIAKICIAQHAFDSPSRKGKVFGRIFEVHLTSDEGSTDIHKRSNVPVIFKGDIPSPDKVTYSDVGPCTLRNHQVKP